MGGKWRRLEQYDKQCLEELKPFLDEQESVDTRKKYERDMLGFCRFLHMTPNEIKALRYEHEKLSKEDKQRFFFEDKVREYKRFLVEQGKGKVSESSASSRTIGVRGYFKSIHSKLEIETKKVGKTEYRTGEVIFTQHELQIMFKNGTPRQRALLSLGLCIPLGSSQFCKLERDILEQQIRLLKEKQLETPFELVTRRHKEGTLLRAMITGEAIDSLLDYWRTLGDGHSKYIFSTNGGTKPLTPDILNDELKRMWKLNFPNVPREEIRWHWLRKYVISKVCPKCGDSVAKVMTGKTVSGDFFAYMSGVKYQDEYSKVAEDLCLSTITNQRMEQIQDIRKMMNVFSKLLVRILIKEMKPEDMKELGIEELLTSETIMSSDLERILEIFQRKEEEYSVTARKGRKQAYETR